MVAVVGLHVGRPRRQVVAAHVGCYDAKARVREWLDLQPPAEPELREAVQQNDQRPFTHLDVMQAHVADVGVSFTKQCPVQIQGVDISSAHDSSSRSSVPALAGVSGRAQKSQWCIDEKSSSTTGPGVARDSTRSRCPNDGHGTSCDEGLPVAAKFAHAVRMLAASASWSAFKVAGTGVFGWSNRYWISDECVAIGGSAPGGANRCGAVSSLNW